jgi:N-acetylglucosaminyldiphosphoundecaprenol N-acetyl-beta-D-mannosaminyltransferase
LTYSQTVAYVDTLIGNGEPSYFVTANLNTVMLAQQFPALREAAREAAFVVADGITLVWAASWKGAKLPERVTGSDLIYGLSELAAQKGYGIFLLGGAEGVTDAAASRLISLYPGLRIVGTASPPHRPLTPQEQRDLIETIRAARPDLLFVAYGQPKGEIWIRDHYHQLGVPVSVQVGASIDFVAGRVRRAPRWVQRIHMETPYRILQEPRRLAPRYFKNALFLIHMIARDAWGGLTSRSPSRNPLDPSS